MMNPIAIFKTCWFGMSQICVAAVALYVVQLHGWITPVCTTQVIEYYDSVEVDSPPEGKKWRKK